MIDYDRKYTVDAHCNTKKHKKGIEASKNTNIQIFSKDPQSEFNEKLVEAFLSADIPLYKFRNSKIKELFQLSGFVTPSETSARKLVDVLGSKQDTFLKEFFYEKDIFVIFDESEINKIKYCNVLFGLVWFGLVWFGLV